MLTQVQRPLTYDIDIVRGDTFRQVMVISSNGVPVDLTGWTFGGDVFREPGDLTPITAITVTVLDTLNGQIQAFISNTVTAGFPLCYLNYSVRGVAPSGDVQTLLRGFLMVSPQGPS